MVYAVPMRIFFIFIKYLFTLGVIAGILYATVPFVLLNIATAQFIRDTKMVGPASQVETGYASICKKAPASSDLSRPLAIQLRFEDPATYSIELVCSLIENTPVTLQTKKLPFLVSKVGTAAGVYYDFEHPVKMSIRLRSLYAKQDITFDGQNFVRDRLDAEPIAYTKPVTACAGYGYQCCHATTQKGVGDTQTRATDCPTSCFAACAEIPHIQVFSSDPYAINQEILMSSQTIDITFNYIAVTAHGKVARVDIDYGDGSHDSSIEGTGIFSHSFSCPGPCRIPVRIRAVDSNENVSIENETTTLYIVRQ